MVKVYRSTVLEAPIEAAWEILRDFNGHDRWHPVVAQSQIERGLPADKVGCVRTFQLKDGSKLRERLLTLSDLETAFSYCLHDTPLPLFNYVAHVRLTPVTDQDWTFWEWESSFDPPPDRKDELTELVAENIYQAGFEAIQTKFALEST
ncbi:MAG: SRPBCC family protein [Roseobacter sp.]